MAPNPPKRPKDASRGDKTKPKSSKTNFAIRKKPGPAVKRPPPKQQKTKPGVHNPAGTRKKRRVYTEKELNLPAVNMITPVGVEKPGGKKRGKVFVDDQASMMTILAMVNAEKEGQIESKMMRARQMEEIRDARAKEAETKELKRRGKLEEKKEEIKEKKREKVRDKKIVGAGRTLEPAFVPSRKRVSFAAV